MDRDSRRISVYDLTGLRVHPNGYRVHQTERNLELGKHSHNIQDSRGWVANDAGGSISVPKYRNGGHAPSSDAEYIDAEQAENDQNEQEDEDEEDSMRKGKRKKQNNMGPIKRRKFMENDSYITVLSQMSETVGKDLEMPSQDLLKNIHFFAAKYYDERDLLVNTAKRYRREKRLRKLGHLSGGVSDGTLDSRGPNPLDTEQVADNDADGRRRKVNRDMYRVLDGSVLVALGVLAQEVVKKFVSSKGRSQYVSPVADYMDDEVGEVEEAEDPIEDFEDERNEELVRQISSGLPKDSEAIPEGWDEGVIENETQV
ncbi:hypothetical protein P691DRAFT_774949 [Macrolepiota fuliginosa MF-IS2]|uniref:Uncharacterized protein n=1 Tax=Macrolepiota fuliginosa MF-IS2 TaxID=1400762 RepID=A0A9P5XEU6_9AGAR|nr:hypothetical protein P691DRAFT_774949 [Macrolepiota fuliginosa MF-IS2]